MCNKMAFQQQMNHHFASKFRNYRGHSGKRAWKQHFQAGNRPPVNVRELDDQYELYLFAPGYEKNDFAIAITDQTLSITLERKIEEDTTWMRQEYHPKGFVRKFDLGEKVDASSITAKYEKGVLILNLPKLEGFETVRQEISVG